MEKRGQVTIFIIVAILLIAIVAFFYISSNSSNSSLGAEQIPSNIEPVYRDFQSCFEKASDEGIHYIATHGGYYEVPYETSIRYFTEEIPYYFLDSKGHIPSRNLVEKELSKYISDNLKDCFNLENYKEKGFSINGKNYSIFANIDEKIVNVKMADTLTIAKGNDTSEFDNIELDLNYNLKSLHAASVDLVDSYLEKPGSICLTCFDKISNKNEVYINTLPIGDISVFENNIIWFYITNKDDVSENKLTWVFIVEQ